MRTLPQCLDYAKSIGYESCTNPAHGFGSICEIGGKEAETKIMICPLVQFYPKPAFLFHNLAQFDAFVDEDMEIRRPKTK